MWYGTMIGLDKTSVRFVASLQSSDFMAEQVNRPQRKPVWRGTHDLKVIGAGFSRTGSYSLRLALEQLGFNPCFHIIDVMGDEDKANALMWWKGIDRRLKADKHSVDFDEFYGKLAHGAQAAVDWPTFFYWRELAEYYPSMKLIVTVRDKEKWYQSCIAALNLYFYNPMLRVLVALKLVDLIHFVATELIPKSVEEFGGIDRFYNDKQAVFDQMDKRIECMTTDQRYKDRVLIFRVADGWEPLCEFLNVDVPETPFPRSNDGAALALNIRKYTWKCLQKLSANYSIILLMVFVAIATIKSIFLTSRRDEH